MEHKLGDIIVYDIYAVGQKTPIVKCAAMFSIVNIPPPLTSRMSENICGKCIYSDNRHVFNYSWFKGEHYMVYEDENTSITKSKTGEEVMVKVRKELTTEEQVMVIQNV